MMVYPMRAKSLGDAESRFLAQKAFITVLWTDPRVERCYQDWRSEFGLDALIPRLQQPLDDAERDNLCGELLLRYDAALRVVPRLMAALLEDFPAFPWLNERLGDAFGVELANEAEPGLLKVQTVILTPPEAQRGRGAKGGADRVRRDVEWFYRVHVKQPPESVRALAREMIRAGRLHLNGGDGRSTVQDGIASARALLE